MAAQTCRAVLAATTAACFAAGVAASDYHPPAYDSHYCAHPVAAYSKAVYGDHAYCFQKHPLSLSHWGWTHKICRGSEQKHVLWADAYGCDTRHGYPVGAVHVAYDEYGTLYVKAEGKDGCDVGKLYVYVGTDYLPKHKGAYSVSPYSFEYAYSDRKVYEFEVADKYGPYTDCVYIVVYAEACCRKEKPSPKPHYPRPLAPPAPRTDCYGEASCGRGQCRVPGSCKCSYRVKCKINPCSQYACEYGSRCVPNACGACAAFCVKDNKVAHPPASRPLAPPVPAPCGPYAPPCDQGQCREPGSCKCSYKVKCKEHPCSKYTCRYGYKCVPNACNRCTAWCVPIFLLRNY